MVNEDCPVEAIDFFKDEQNDRRVEGPLSHGEAENITKFLVDCSLANFVREPGERTIAARIECVEDNKARNNVVAVQVKCCAEPQFPFRVQLLVCLRYDKREH